MSDKQQYPRLTKLGIDIVTDYEGPPGVNHEQLVVALKRAGQLRAWARWCGGGITCGPNGVYPWDVERFLRGLPNDD